MTLFIFFGNSPKRDNLAKELAKKRCVYYYKPQENETLHSICDHVLTILDSGQGALLNFAGSISKLRSLLFSEGFYNHFTIFFELLASNEFVDTEPSIPPPFFVFNYSSQEISSISLIITEILSLHHMYGKYLPFTAKREKVKSIDLIAGDPAVSVKKMPLESIYYLLLCIIKDKDLFKSIPQLTKRMNFLMHFYGIVYGYLPKGTLIYRIRFNKKKLFPLIANLWHPCKKKTNMGRFNRKHLPVFYGGENISLCFYETDNGKNDSGRYTQLVCRLKSDLKFGFLSSVNISGGDAKSNVQLQNYIKYVNNTCSDNEILINNFVGNYINEPSFFSSDFDYETTNIISDFLYRDDQLPCFIYPSTKFAYRSNNIVISQKHAKTYLEPVAVQVYEYKKGKRFLDVNPKLLFTGKVFFKRFIKYKRVQ